jgi:hypothetical protein
MAKTTRNVWFGFEKKKNAFGSQGKRVASIVSEGSSHRRLSRGCEGLPGLLS